MKRVLTYLLLLVPLLLHAQEYHMPIMPDSLIDTPSRVRWALNNYWNSFQFSDSTLLTPTYAEQAFVNYLSLLPYGSHEEQQHSISHWWQIMDGCSAARRYFFDSAEHYLYHPNSPMRSESRWRMILSEIGDRDDGALRSRAHFALRMINQNQVGETTTDVSLQLPDGSESSLLSSVRGTPTLLLFYDPECEHCQQVLTHLRSDEHVNVALSSVAVQLLAVYTGEETAVWLRHLQDLPPTWHHASDRGVITSHMSYDLRSLPVIYLLTAEGKIDKKEAVLSEVDAWCDGHKSR